jgi:hypothetical protein
MNVTLVGGGVAGFIAGADANVTLNNCRVLARSITITGPAANRYAGFVANIRGNLSNCYSNTPLNITLTDTEGSTMIGGFAAELNSDVLGGANADWTIENCYAAGSVTVQSPGSSNTKALRVGGFIGSLGAWGDGVDFIWSIPDQYRDVHIKNCYALGSVTVTRNSPGDISAGGFAGIVMIPNANVLAHSFATGAVLASSTSTGAVYAGGLVGLRQQGTIQSCAAIGPSVTALGGGFRAVGRIYGYAGSGSASANYALNTMTLERDSSTTTLTPVVQTPNNNVTGQDGGDVFASILRSAYPWTTTMGFGAEWDMSGVARGYPALAGLGGQ